jgi:hypothetical protein
MSNSSEVFDEMIHKEKAVSRPLDATPLVFMSYNNQSSPISPSLSHIPEPCSQSRS